MYQYLICKKKATDGQRHKNSVFVQQEQWKLAYTAAARKRPTKWNVFVSRVQRANHAVFALCRGEKTRFRRNQGHTYGQKRRQRCECTVGVIIVLDACRAAARNGQIIGSSPNGRTYHRLSPELCLGRNRFLRTYNMRYQ